MHEVSKPLKNAEKVPYFFQLNICFSLIETSNSEI